MSRKPWETSIEYNSSDRWGEPSRAVSPASDIVQGDDDERDGRDIDEILNRAPREERDYECTDTTPINYSKGPHDEEFGVDEKDFNPDAENPPVPYENGPHDDEFGVDDEDEDSLEPADNDNDYIEE